MKKDNLISFRVSADLRESLLQIAKEDRRSLSSTIEMVLADSVEKRKAFSGIKKEKRQYPRENISVPAVINPQNHDQIGIGAITEISLGGLRILIPKDFQHNLMIDLQGSKFEIVFNLPSENKPIKLSCESRNVIDDQEGIRVGASFVDGDFQSYKALQTYLM
jgi:hypothetical protein